MAGACLPALGVASGVALGAFPALLWGFWWLLRALLWWGGALPACFGFGSLWGFGFAPAQFLESSFDRAAFSL